MRTYLINCSRITCYQMEERLNLQLCQTMSCISWHLDWRSCFQVVLHQGCSMAGLHLWSLLFTLDSWQLWLGKFCQCRLPLFLNSTNFKWLLQNSWLFDWPKWGGDSYHHCHSWNLHDWCVCHKKSCGFGSHCWQLSGECHCSKLNHCFPWSVQLKFAFRFLTSFVCFRSWFALAYYFNLLGGCSTRPRISSEVQGIGVLHSLILDFVNCGYVSKFSKLYTYF